MFTKIIDITDPQKGTLKETIVNTESKVKEEVQEVGGTRNRALESLGLGKYRTLREVATTSQFPALLRVGLKQILFDSYDQTQSTFQEWCRAEQSDKPAEDWIEMNRFGTLPIVGEGDPVPFADIALDRTVRIVNSKYAMRFAITEEMIKFDKSNQIRQFPADMGEAAKQTLEATAYSILSTTGNYTRNSTTSDNDVGSNTSANALTGPNLVTAMGTLVTMKDRKSGRFFGITPDTLIVTPRLEFSAKMLLMAPDIFRASAYTTAEVYGTGQTNPFRGIVNRIIVSPFLGTGFQWVLMKARRAVVYQEVEPLQLLTGAIDYQNNGSYITYDRIEYRVRLWFGFGMLNDRFAYLSTGATPAVA